MTEQERKSPSVSDIRKAIESMKRANALRKEVKFYKIPIRNWPLFHKMLKTGRIRQSRPGGPWEICD